MNNPWQEIDLNDYEKHMRLDSVYQLQTMNEMIREQLYTRPVQSAMILGIAGGNGLEHVDQRILDRVYGVDINADYLSACISRYPALQGTFEAIQADLTQSTAALPYADLLIANLFIEYVGYECFQSAVAQVQPKFVSCVIQVNTDVSFVSDSPYVHVFDRLSEIHHQIEENALAGTLRQIGYETEMRAERALPNGKKLVRIEFAHADRSHHLAAGKRRTP